MSLLLTLGSVGTKDAETTEGKLRFLWSRNASDARKSIPSIDEGRSKADSVRSDVVVR